MTKTLAGIALAAALLVPGARARAAEAPKKVGTSEAVMVKATVEAVDVANRTVTLKGPKGKSFTVSVDPKFQALDKLKVGDEVVARYYEAIAFELKKPGEAVPGKTVTEGVAALPAGQKPAGAAGQQVRIVATITAIDKANGSVTLTGADGKKVDVKARDPKNLDKVKVGDLVEITYTEALAISVEPVRK
jgi:hypothetical protein